AGADILTSRQLVAADRLVAEGKEGIDRDVERGTAPGNTDDRNEHHYGRDEPGTAHQKPAEDQPEEIESEGHSAPYGRIHLLAMLVRPPWTATRYSKRMPWRSLANRASRQQSQLRHLHEPWVSPDFL